MVPMRASTRHLSILQRGHALVRGLASATFLGLLLVGLVAGCGSGSSGSSGAQPTTPQAGITVVEISNPSVSTIAVVVDQYGKESLTLAGNKDALGQPVNLTEIYYSALGKNLKIEMGSDGLPSVISDEIGNKFSFTNYTASTVDITFFDQEGGRVIGPFTIPVDSAKLTLLKNANSTLQQGSVVAGIQGLARDDVRLLLD